MEAQITLTHHAIRRARERCRWNEETMRKMATKARAEGIGLSQVKGQLHRYLYKLTMQHRTETIVYGEHIFAFADNVVVTVIPLATQYCGTMRKIKKLSAGECQSGINNPCECEMVTDTKARARRETTQ